MVEDFGNFLKKAQDSIARERAAEQAQRAKEQRIQEQEKRQAIELKQIGAVTLRESAAVAKRLLDSSVAPSMRAVSPQIEGSAYANRARKSFFSPGLNPARGLPPSIIEKRKRQYLQELQDRSIGVWDLENTWEEVKTLIDPDEGLITERTTHHAFLAENGKPYFGYSDFDAKVIIASPIDSFNPNHELYSCVRYGLARLVVKYGLDNFDSASTPSHSQQMRSETGIDKPTQY